MSKEMEDLIKIVNDVNQASIDNIITKREQFAAMAMQGLCACGVPGTHNQPKNLSAEAVRQADALLAELAKEQGDV